MNTVSAATSGGDVKRDNGSVASVAAKALPSTVTIELNLSASDCPECVLPKDLLVDILGSRLRESDPDMREVDLIDPREDGDGSVYPHT